MNPELVFILIIFLFSVALFFVNPKKGIILGLFLSLLLHKELFSIYVWNLMPVRVFFAALLVYVVFIEVHTLFLHIQRKSLSKKHFVGSLSGGGPFLWLLAILFLVNLSSIAFSANFKASLSVIAFFSTIVAFGFLLFKMFAQDHTQIKKLLDIYVFMVFVLCLIGFIQIALYVYNGVIFGAFWNVSGHPPRVGSLFWDVNHLAGLLAMLIPYCLASVLISKPKLKILYGSYVFVFSVILLLTGGRTAWMALGVSITVLVALILYKRFRMKGVSALSILIAIVLVLGVFEYSQKESIFRATLKQYFHYRMDSFDSHFLLLQGAVEVFEKYPVLGGGYGSFFEHFSTTPVSAEFFARDTAALSTRVPAHSIWGESLAETGSIGFVTTSLLYLSLIGLLFYGFLNIKNTKDSLLLAAMGASVIGILFAGLFYSYNSEFYWIVLFFYYFYALGTVKRLLFSNSAINFKRVYLFFLRDGKVPVILLSVLAGVLIFAELGTNHLIPYDEAIYATISRNIHESGDPLNLTWQGKNVWMEKPPLYMWFTAFLFKIFGPTEFAVRLTSALFGFASVFLTYAFARRLWGKIAGFVSGLCLLTTFHFLYYSRTGMLDVTATFFILLSFYSYYLFSKFGFRMRYMLMAGLSCGLAVMTKGVVGLIPLMVIMFHLVLSFAPGLLCRPSELSKKKIVLGAIIFGLSALVVVLPWHLYMHFTYPDFLKTYLGYHVIDRAATSIEDKGRPFFWYIEVAKVSMRVWFVCLLPSLVFFLFSLIKYKKQRVELTLLVLWIFITFILFSSAVSKLIWYIMPLYPVLALICGFFVAYVIHNLARVTKRVFLVKFGMLSAVLVFVLGYLFINRGLVYVSDLTGSQAILLQTKDAILGTDTKVYADRIEYPLLFFYTRGPFEVVDFGPLFTYLQLAQINKAPLVFITKESRLRSFQETYPNLRLIEQKKEWVLAIYRP